MSYVQERSQSLKLSREIWGRYMYAIKYQTVGFNLYEADITVWYKIRVLVLKGISRSCAQDA